MKNLLKRLVPSFKLVNLFLLIIVIFIIQPLLFIFCEFWLYKITILIKEELNSIVEEFKELS